MMKKLNFAPWMVQCGMDRPDAWRHSGLPGERRKELFNALLKAALWRTGVSDFSEFEKTLDQNLFDLTEAAGFDYMTISSGSGDISELRGYFSDYENLTYIQQLFYSFLEPTGEADMSSDYLHDYVEEIVDNFFVGDPFEENPEETVERVYDCALAFNKLSQGDLKGLGNREAADFVKSIALLFEPMLSEEFVALNLDLFTPTLFQGCCDYNYCTHILGSEEVYRYLRYRERLPEDIRERMDNALKVYENPFSDSFSDYTSVRKGESSVDGKDYHILAFVTTAFPYNEVSVGTGCLSIFWQSAVRYLGEELPKLRKRYGDADEASPVFFCALFCFFSFPFISKTAETLEKSGGGDRVVL